MLPPRWTKESHQTDLRLAVDCAAVVFYEKRRKDIIFPIAVLKE